MLNSLKNILFGLIFLIIINCATLRNATLLNQGDKIRIYAIDATEYVKGVEKNILQSTKKIPSLTDEQLNVLFESLFFHDNNFFSGDPRPVLYKDDLIYVVPRIKKSITKVKPGQSMLIVYKRLSDGNLVRTTLRTTILFWYDKNGYNIALGESRKILLSEDLYTQYKKWGDIDRINAKDIYKSISLDVKKPFTHKEIENRSHDFWVYLNKTGIDYLVNNHERPKILTDLEEDGSTSNFIDSNIETSKEELIKAKPKAKEKELDRKELLDLIPDEEELKLGNEKELIENQKGNVKTENSEYKKDTDSTSKRKSKNIYDDDFKFNFKVDGKSNTKIKNNENLENKDKKKFLIKPEKSTKNKINTNDINTEKNDINNNNTDISDTEKNKSNKINSDTINTEKNKFNKSNTNNNSEKSSLEKSNSEKNNININNKDNSLDYNNSEPTPPSP